MSKKTRKMKQRAAERRAMQTPAQPSASAPTSDFPARATTTLDFDYSHIYSDLKRIALFAGFFFAVLIILSFVIK
jgi:hypothetical protein